jgi:hypothetical protein
VSIKFLLEKLVYCGIERKWISRRLTNPKSAIEIKTTRAIKE